MKIIDWSRHKGTKYEDLLILYRLDDLEVRRKSHHYTVMFRQSQDPSNLDLGRLGIELRSNKTS